ncbi:dnaJ homolog subfamily C member 2-like [Gigantopelta aegis]|uniref:dnaJ homolog subfamily C member 2-like n=1 Tax=Gigantopelta aegis TaxID=1735272 RepID=UPI001B8879B9|nr:dnaJ homolog subfamily C member 2-like [Gigantopelta aegis]
MLPRVTDEDVTVVFEKITVPLALQVEPVGRWFEAYSQRLHSKHSVSQHSLSSSSSDESDDDQLFDNEDTSEALLLGLDPKEWKQQDHYAVLGLKRLRYKATEDQIKRAYKKKVLRHHPDKRKARGLKVKDGEDDYFTCITRAYEILGNPQKRRSYDSVDPEFDDDVPPVNQYSKDHYFEVFRPVFERNARWSNSKKRVPPVGDENSSFEDLNDFFAFWYDFDSWREYSYLDEEEKEKGENRDERRWIEKQNRAERQKRKKSEVSRIRQLVDNAYACDPRIQRFKDEEKAKKLAQKQAKQDAARQRAEEEERVKQEALEEERKKREKEEEAARQQAAALKKERDAQKKAFKKERKTLRACLKDFDYFSSSDSERVSNMQEVEKLSEMLSLTSLQELNEGLTGGDAEKAKAAFHQHVKELNRKVEKEKMEQLSAMKRSAGGEGGRDKKKWNEMEVQFLIKAVNLFPAGTQDRWDVIAKFIGQHVEGSDKNAKDVLAKAKELQKNDFALKEDAQKRAYEHFVKEHKVAASSVQDQPSQRMESVVDQQLRETGMNPAPWTTDEQKMLEQALKTYNASTPERWEKIAEAVNTRSKKDCMKRYKEICEMVRAKKAAVEAAAKEKKS